MKNIKILLVGGGTGGHICPLKNLADNLEQKNAQVELVVSDRDLDLEITNQLFPKTKTYYLKTGKIRRYFSLQNFIDFFQIFGGIFRARKILNESKPDVIFFKGGFVCFPILIAAKFMFPRFKSKIYLHESDISTGTPTKLIEKFATKVFSNFGTPPFRLFYTSPVTKSHSKNETKRITIFGGSQGAEFLNKTFQSNAETICRNYFVTLISGIGKKIDYNHENFEQFQFLSAETLTKKINESDLVISRAGSNSLFEILSAKKPSIIIPLPSVARNHQFLNAKYFEEKKLLKILEQNAETSEKLTNLINKTINNQVITNSLQKSDIKNNSKEIAEIILEG